MQALPSDSVIRTIRVIKGEFCTPFDRKWFTDFKKIGNIGVGALIREQSFKMCATDPRASVEN